MRRDFLSGIPLVDGEWRREGRWWVHPDGTRVPVIAGGTTAAFTQTHARFRNDDGSQTTATWLANEDTNATLVTDTNYRIRIQVDETAGGTSANFSGVLRYSHNGGAYTAVSASSNVVRASASTNFADEAATTAQLTAPTGTFLTGAMDENDGTAGGTQIDFGAGQYTELEYCFQIRSADVVDGDTIDFRVYRGTNALNVYTVTLRATAREPVAIAVPEGAGSLVGTAVSFAFALGLTATAFGASGQAVGVAFKGPDTGSLDLVGVAPTVSIGTAGGTTIPVPEGALTLTGQAPTLQYDIRRDLQVGDVALTGQASSLQFGYDLPAAAVTVDGQALSLQFAIPIPNGTATLAGEALADLGLLIPHSAGTLTLEGLIPTPVESAGGVAVSIPAGALTTAGQAPTLQFDTRADVQAGSLVLTSVAPAQGLAIGIPDGSLVITGFTPTLTGEGAISPEAGALTLAGQAPTRTVAIGIELPAGALDFTGNAPSLTGAGAVSPGAGTVTLTGQVPQAQVAYTLALQAGAITVSGETPSRITGQFGALQSGAIVLTGQSPTITQAYLLSLGSGVLTLSGTVPGLAMGAAELSAGVLTLTGYAPIGGITVQADVFVTVKARIDTIRVPADIGTVQVNEDEGLVRA